MAKRFVITHPKMISEDTHNHIHKVFVEWIQLDNPSIPLILEEGVKVRVIDDGKNET